MKKANKTLSILTLILAGEAIFLLPFVLMRVFRPIIREAFNVTDFEIGKAQALYGVTAMLSYVFGGYLADKWEARKLICASLLLTALGGVFMLKLPSFFELQLLYGFWGISTILLFWSALIKATRLWGTSANQGISFGLLDGGRGAFAGLIATFGAFIPLLVFPEDTSEITFEVKARTMQYIIGFVTCVVLMVALLVWNVLQSTTNQNENGLYKLEIKDIFKTLFKPKVFFHAVIIVCAYSTYKMTDVFSTYAKDVWNYSLKDASNFGVAMQWLRPISAIALGWLADRFMTSKMVIFCFSLILTGTICLGFGLVIDVSIVFSMLIIIVMAIGIYAMRGLYFALIEEAKTPLPITGTVVGIISLIGYTPDIFMSLITGFILGENPTLVEYQSLFKVVALFPLVGILAMVRFRFHNRKQTYTEGRIK